MPKTDLTAATARAVGTGLALVLPVTAMVVLRLFPRLFLDPADATGWLAPLVLGAVAISAGVAAVPLLGSLVADGRLASGASGVCAVALAAGCAALALSGPRVATTLPDSGLALTVLIATVALGVSVLAEDRTLDVERTRWFGVFVALVLAESALGAALLAPGSALDAGTTGLMVIAAVIAAAAAAASLSRQGKVAWGAVIMAAAASLLAMARPGSFDALVGLAALAVAPQLLVTVPAARSGAEIRTPTRSPSAKPSALTDGPVSTSEADAAERDRLARELRAALGELTDARHTIALQRAELERAADVDPLTGVASRAAIMDRLRDEVSGARRYPHPVSIVLVDVDHMGDLNAQHGTAVGDAVLRELALRMRVRVREADAIGRVAGDAFLAILPHTDEAGATVFADAIRDRAVSRPISTGRGEVSVSVSIGVSTMRPRMELTADAFLGRVDEAVASARAGGGNIIAFDRLHGLARLEDRRPNRPDEASDLHGQNRTR